MAAVPKRARDLMRPGTIMALATASADGEPNVAPMQQCWRYADDVMIVGDFFMNKTKANIMENGRAAFAAWREDPREGYKFTGSAKYLTRGPEYDLANSVMKKKLPDKDFKGVVVIRVEKVFDIKSGPAAGQLIEK